MKLATIAVAGWRASANSAVASAVPRLAAATRESAPIFFLSGCKRNAPPTADAPIAPSSTPYSAGPPAIRVRATNGRSAQYALPNTKNATVRIRVARR